MHCDPTLHNDTVTTNLILVADWLIEGNRALSGEMLLVRQERMFCTSMFDKSV